MTVVTGKMEDVHEDDGGVDNDEENESDQDEESGRGMPYSLN